MIDAPSGPAVPLADANGPLLSGDLAEIQVITPASQDGETRVAGNSATANLRDPAQEITIRAVAASWVEIVRDNGEEVMAKLMQVGDSYVVEGNTRLVMLVGWKLSSEAMTRVQSVERVRLFAICRWLLINYGRRSSPYPSPVFPVLLFPVFI